MRQPATSEYAGPGMADLPPSISPSGTASPVLAFVSDEQSEAVLRACLRELADGLKVRRGNIVNAIATLEKETVDGILLVDVTGSADPLRDLDRLARICRPNLRVLVIGDNSDIAFYRALVGDLGVAEYLPKPLTRGSVTSLFGPHIVGTAALPEAGRGGRVVVFCGARGGVGTSTLAVNAALHLSTLSHTHVALLDLHLIGGSVALMMGTRPSQGLRAALEAPERADSLFLDRVSVVVDDRLKVIAAEEAFDAQVDVSEAAVLRVVDLLRQRSNFVLIDMPTPPPPAMWALISEANLTVVVLGPDLTSVRNGRALRQLVTNVAAQNSAFTVLNRAGLPGGLDADLVTKGLGAAPDATVPDLGRQLLQAENLGVPAVRKNDALRRALGPIVQEISGVEQKVASGSWLARMGLR
jgi:pilus assembly protein CpaE